MNKKTPEEILKNNDYFLDFTVGDSMYPMLRNRKDTVIISKIKSPLKKFDLPLYRRDSGRLVLHRIIKIKNGFYYTRGDNRTGREKNLTDENMIGILTGFYRGEKFISVNDFKYKLYVYFWQFIYPIRYVFYKFKLLYKMR